MKLGLAAENDLQQLVAVGLEIREQANLFEQVFREQVRFVNHQYGAHSLRVTRHQQVAERAQHSRFRGLRFHAKFAGQQIEELFGREERIEDVGCEHGAIKRLQHGAQDSRLAAADFAGDYDNAFAIFDAVLEIGKDFQQAFSSKQMPWVGRQAEWDVAQSVKFL